MENFRVFSSSPLQTSPFPTPSTEVTMKMEIKRELISLNDEAKLLLKINEIRKILLSNGAYSHKNMEMQNLKFESARVPEWEKNIIRESWDSTTRLSHILLKRLEKLNKLILEEVKKIDKDD